MGFADTLEGAPGRFRTLRIGGEWACRFGHCPESGLGDSIDRRRARWDGAGHKMENISARFRKMLISGFFSTKAAAQTDLPAFAEFPLTI